KILNFSIIKKNPLINISNLEIRLNPLCLEDTTKSLMRSFLMSVGSGGDTMATFNSFAALERQIMKDMRTAAQRAKDKIEMELIMNVNGYYDGSTPQRYQRTGTLLTSPDSTPVQG